MVQSTTKSFQRQVKPLCPPWQGERQPVERNYFHIPFVSCLFSPRGPLAVFWGVSLAVVLSFNGMPSRWARPHVFQEIRKAACSKPSLADCDSASTIVFVAQAVWLEAPDLHLAPDNVLWPLSSINQPGCSWASLVLATSAATAVSVSENISSNFLECPALTPTRPVEQLSFGLCRGNDCQHSNDFAGQVFAISGWLPTKQVGFYATAALTHARLQPWCPYDFFGSAVATAHPRKIFPSLVGEANYGPAVKSESGQVFEVHGYLVQPKL